MRTDEIKTIADGAIARGHRIDSYSEKMSVKQIHFFAANDDLMPVLSSVESKLPLQYVKFAHFSHPEPEKLFHGIELPNLGIANADSHSRCSIYAIAFKDQQIHPRRFIRLGETAYSFDQLLNPDTVTFAPGGQWGTDFIINGRVATCTSSERSRELMKKFQAAIKKHFTKVKSFYVGPTALVRLKQGARLVASASSPREYDLTESA